MSDKPQHKNPKLHSKRHLQKTAALLSPEEKAKFIAEQVKAAAEAKAERERVELFGKSVQKMSHRQLRGELRRSIRREYAGKPPEPQAGLTIALSTIFLAVLNNTKTSTIFETHEDGTPKRVARPNQINSNGRLNAYPL